MNALLHADEVQRELEALPGWMLENGELVREFRFPRYLDGIAFVNAVATLAEAANHHPDMEVGWRKVRLRLCTHSAGGLTALDFALARKVDKV